VAPGKDPTGGNGATGHSRSLAPETEGSMISTEPRS
jgi:hypothetical protein